MKYILMLLFAFSLLSLSSRTLKPHNILYSELVPADQRNEFTNAVIQTAERLKINPDWLMVCFRFETMGTFRPNVKNKYSGAIGLIQFIPSTAYRLGTTPQQLERMNLVQQLVYVEKYFSPYAGKMNNVYDCYLVIFAPAFLGRTDQTILYSKYSPTQLGKNRYNWNRILDKNRDGVISIKDVKQQIKRFVG